MTTANRKSVSFHASCPADAAKTVAVPCVPVSAYSITIRGMCAPGRHKTVHIRSGRSGPVLQAALKELSDRPHIEAQEAKHCVPASEHSELTTSLLDERVHLLETTSCRIHTRGP
jgi:hypothetical protein